MRLPVQMSTLLLPSTNQGLGWIADQEPHSLLLIFGVRAASITAAADGDERALTHLRTMAELDVTNTHNLSDSEFYDLASCSHMSPGVSALHTEIKAAGYLTATYGEEVEHTMVTLITAVRSGRLASLQWLRALCQPVDPDMTMLMSHAYEQQHGHIVKYLSSGPNYVTWFQWTLNRGAELEGTEQHHGCLEFLLGQVADNPPPHYVVTGLAERGELEILKSLHDRTPLPKMLRSAAVNIAIEHGHQPLLEWLQSLDDAIPLRVG